MGAARQLPVPEPVEIDGIPDRLEKLSRGQKQAVVERAEGLAKELAAVARLVTLKGTVSPLDGIFAKVARRERFDLPLEGIERLSTGLRLPARQQWKRDPALRDALYVLYRLHIAKTIVDDLAATKIDVPLALVLTVFRREGGFALPLGLDELRLGVLPPPTPTPNWGLTNSFLGSHFSVDLEKEAPPWLIYGPLIRGVRRRVESRTHVLHALERQRPPSDDLEWLGAAKQAAFTVYLLLLGGLDYMTTSVSWPGLDSYGDQRLVFRYLHARNRAAIEPELPIADLLQDGESLFAEICRVEPEAFREGHLPSHALAMLLQGTGENQQHFVVPVQAPAFTKLIIREAVVALESMRRVPLWCGGKGFKPPLPAAVAYLRYNGGDVHFTVMVLNLLDRILNGSSLPSARLTRSPASRLRNGLADFKKSRNRGVWTILEKWERETEETSFLKSKSVRRGSLWRTSLLKDAKDSIASVPGPAELRFRSDLNSTGQMSTALPVIEAITEKNLWPEVLKLMVSPVGRGQRPWIGHSPNRIGNEIGLNVLRFHYTLRGYETVFRA